MPIDSGLDRLTKRLNAIPRQVRTDVVPALLKGAEDMAADMRRLAPVDKGDLIESIAVTPPGESTPPHSQPGGKMIVPELSVAVTAGNNKVRTAHLVEYGTAAHVLGGMFAGAEHPGTAAQPFFWPGYRLNRKKVTARIRRAIRKAVKGNANG